MRGVALVALTTLVIASSATLSYLLLLLYPALTLRPFGLAPFLALTTFFTALGLASVLKLSSAGWLPLMGLVTLVLLWEGKPHMGLKPPITLSHLELVAIALSALYLALTLIPKAVKLAEGSKALANEDLSVKFLSSILGLCLAASSLTYLLLSVSKGLSPSFESLTGGCWYLTIASAVVLVALSYYVYVRVGGRAKRI